MVRTILYLLISILLITFLRAVIGLIAKAMGQALAPERRDAAPKSPPKGFGGELKRDPVCGMFVSTETSVKKTVRDEVYYFCSPACRDKFMLSG
jgi:YHS domain-containing protein